MEDTKIKILIEQCVSYFHEHHYTNGVITRYVSLWCNGIVPFMDKKGVDIYTPDIGAEFLSTFHHEGKVGRYAKNRIRSIHMLDDLLTFGYVRKRSVSLVYHVLEGEIGIEMNKLIAHLTNLRRSKSTLYQYRLHLSDFINYLTLSGAKIVNDITENHLITFISSHPNKASVLTELRVLFRFWKEENIIDGRFMDLFDNYKHPVRKRIPSFFTKEEVLQIENSISRSSGIGKRDYAIVLLASRLGLRASDIAGLQFSDIDWDKNLITLKMKKTGKIMELPLLADVGNAIVDYLRNGRPNSNLKHIFLSLCAPYSAATKELVCGVIDRIVRKSGVSLRDRHHGPHALRHSLASAMLEDGRTIPVISETLGHSSTETTMTYLRIDVKSLLKCALPVPPVSSDFYKQKGGVFYGGTI